MKFKGYGPVVMIIVFLTVLAGARSLLSQGPEPEMLQSQVGGAENSLEQVATLELEIELRDDSEIELRYMARGEGSPMVELRRDDRNENLSGDDALEGVRVVIESSPPLTTSEPLTLIQSILDQLSIHQADVREFELEYELVDGTERSIELDVDRDRENDDSDSDDD